MMRSLIISTLLVIAPLTVTTESSVPTTVVAQPTTGQPKTYEQKVIEHLPPGHPWATIEAARNVGSSVCRGLNAHALGIADTNYAELRRLIVGQGSISAGDAEWLLDTTIAEVC